MIDSHVHVWKHDPAFPFAEGARPPAEDASAEMLLDLMKANGVSRTVVGNKLSKAIRVGAEGGHLGGMALGRAVRPKCQTQR